MSGSISIDRPSAFPELAVALHEFFRDPNRAAGLYAFCDIGGGTIDGAVFRINRSKGLASLSIPSARVDVLGTMALSQRIADRFAMAPELLEAFFVRPDRTRELMEAGLRDVKAQVQAFVRGIVNDARLKQFGRTFYEEADPRNSRRELRMFMAGGGAASWWYQTAIRVTRSGDTDGAFDGLSRVRPVLVPKPRHFAGDDFPRYVIALGLADIPESMDDAMLPSSIPKKEDLPIRQINRPLYDKG